MLRKMLHVGWLLPRTIAMFLITIYQRTLSPDHGFLKVFYPYGYCPKHPTCSEYGKIIIRERGLILGSLLTLIRLLRCSPWSRLSDEKLSRVVQSMDSEGFKSIVDL